MLACMINNALGGKKEPKDFMPHAQNPDDVEIPLEQAIEEWR